MKLKKQNKNIYLTKSDLKAVIFLLVILSVLVYVVCNYWEYIDKDHNENCIEVYLNNQTNSLNSYDCEEYYLYKYGLMVIILIILILFIVICLVGIIIILGEKEIKND